MSDATDTLEREDVRAEAKKDCEVKHQAEETFAMDGEYIAGQAREAMRVFFLPLSSIVRAARAKGRTVKRDVRNGSKAG
jgi:hypothetical protein